LQKEHPHDALNEYGDPAIFCNEDGDALIPNRVHLYIKQLRNKAGLPETSVVFSHLRDGAATHSNAGHLTQILLGHQQGEIDKYQVRRPITVKQPCLKVEKYYFGKQSS